MTSRQSPVIILTGASRGLGLAIVRILLSRHHARVTTLSRTITPELRAVVDEYGTSRLQVVQGDVGDIATNERVVKDTIERWGRLDGLVINAGSLEPLGMLLPPGTRPRCIMHVTNGNTVVPVRIADIPLDQALGHVQTNLLSALYLIQPALPHLRRTNGETSKVVLISSGSSTTGYTAQVIYSMVKAGFNSLCRTLSAEEKGNGVSVWAVRPGMIDVGVDPSVFANVD